MAHESSNHPSGSEMPDDNSGSAALTGFEPGKALFHSIVGMCPTDEPFGGLLDGLSYVIAVRAVAQDLVQHGNGTSGMDDGRLRQHQGRFMLVRLQKCAAEVEPCGQEVVDQ